MRRAGQPVPLALAAAIGGLLAAQTALAQQADSASDDVYQDRIIAPDKLADLPPDEDEIADESGMPRSLHAELLASRTERGDDTFDEYGVSAGGFLETADWGAFSLDATLFRSSRDRFTGAGDGDGGLQGAATLWQRNLYVNGGWRVDNGLGVLNTPSTPLQRSQYRFYLPAVSFAGASSDWLHAGSNLRLQGAFGRAGIYTGTRIIGFELADGDVASLGAQWQWAPRRTGAASFLATSGRVLPDDRGEPVFEQGDTQALYAATAWQGDRDRVQFNLLGSDGDRGRATGAWFDANAQRGRYRHNYGAFRLGEDLSWGALPISNDVQGGYYRIAYQYARWSWNLGLDSIRSISGDGFDGLYATSFARYQATSTLGYGGSLNLRRSDADHAWNAQVFLDKRTDWGQTRLQLDQARSTDGSDSWQVSVDQALPMRQGNRMSLSLSYGALDYGTGASASRTVIAALYGSRDLTDRLSIDGSARWTHGDGDGALRGSNINLGLNWRLSRHWSATAAYYLSQGSQRSPFVLDPLVTQQPFISLPRDRSLFVTLRYERSAGRPQATLGGSPAGPAGSIAGSVFLDDNDDGARAASEQAAANITVILDGRFAVRTDSLGRFEFPRVAAGSHTLTVMPDNLPLPWFLDEAAARRSVQVQVRQTERVDIGARRQR